MEIFRVFGMFLKDFLFIVIWYYIVVILILLIVVYFVLWVLYGILLFGGGYVGKVVER